MSVAPYHHGDLQKALIREAERVLAEQGVDSISLRQLARALGVSHAAPRAHFSSRDALLIALAERGFTALTEQLAEASASSGSFIDRVVATANSYVRFATDRGPLLALMYRPKITSRPHELEQAESALWQVFISLLQEGQDAGLIVQGRVETVGVPVFAAIHGMAQLFSVGLRPEDERDAEVRNVVIQLFRGVAGPSMSDIP